VIAGTRFRYPHMLPADQLLWDVFLPKYGSYWDGFDYDIHVGEGVGPLPGYPPGIARAALSLTQKRIDAVGYRGSEVWVFEIKPHAGLSAIGQVLSYSELYDTAHPGGLVTHKAIVTDLTDADIHTLCRTWAIRLYSLGNVA